MTAVRRYPGPNGLAAAVAADLVSVLREAQAAGRVPSVVLTGGTVARRVHAAVADHPDREQVEWAGVRFWFGDERFVAADDPERNAGQAAQDMLDRLPVDPALVHAVAASDQAGGPATVQEAAQAYEEALLGDFAGVEEPWFDVLMLGVGPDGHCASLFPGRSEVHATGVTVAVEDSPKPPPLRVSMTMSTLQRAGRVWFVASGDGKADAVARSVAGGDITETPAAGPRGVDSTTWYVDEAAATLL